MKKVLIICAAGISSSLIAKKATEYFHENSKETLVKASSVMAGIKSIASDEYDLYLVSPQTRQYYDDLTKAAVKRGKPIEILPAQAYVANEQGAEILCTFIDSMDY